jgi:hypothetical protein
MNAKSFRWVIPCTLAFVVLGGFFSATSVRADAPPDILDSYTIAIAPNADGSLAMNYTLTNYCAKSDWPGEYPYLQVGVPNGNFSISDWGPKDGQDKVVNAEKVTSGGSFVQLDFDRGNLPKNGDCFDLYFAIVQSKMAYPDTGNGTVTFKFIPSGWNFPINVNTLIVTWALPSDPSLVKLTEPAPASTDATTMAWKWTNPAMNSSGMFADSAIKIAYDKSAFTLPAAAATETSPSTGSGVSNLVIGVILVLVLLVFIVVVCWVLFGSSSDDGYTSGGGYSSVDTSPSYIPTYTPSESRSSSPSRRSESTESSSPSESHDSGSSHSSFGGGFGGSSGHSSSCACASHCACACACAGGARVGCSRKAIGIACLSKVISSISDEQSKDRK